MLAVWNIGDTPMAFYNCVDVNIGGAASSQPAPSPSPSASSAPSSKPSSEPSKSATTSPAGGPAWAPGVSYKVGEKVTYEGVTYQVRQAHTSIRSWEPSIWTLALWLPL